MPFRWMLLLLFCYAVFACGGANVSSTASGDLQDSIPPLPLTLEEELMANGIRLFPDSSLSYTQAKMQSRQLLQQLASSTNIPGGIDSVFVELLANTLIPYWYGTPWSFEGHTAKPGVGEIACGYFISTTLKDLGLRLNRYRLAQQAPIHEAKSLAIDTNLLQVIEGEELHLNIQQIQERTSPGIYFLGFDASHVGFLMNRNGKIYLIHSNYLAAKGVMIERIEESEVFASYRRFYLVPLSGNPGLRQKWLNTEHLAIVTE